MNAERLLKLAEHLETGTLGHKNFDFEVISVGRRDFFRLNCGTAGCAIGELPFVWPKTWGFSRILNRDPLYYPVLRAAPETDYEKSVLDWFDICTSEFDGLFVPREDGDTDHDPWNGFTLYGDATKEQVAKGIRNFVKWRENRSICVLPDIASMDLDISEEDSKYLHEEVFA